MLHRWNYKEDDGKVRLIGTDPALGDATQVFRWIDEPGGWDRREPWPAGFANSMPVPSTAGTTSGWSGVPVHRGPGRPRKAGSGDRHVLVRASLRREELVEVMRRAADAQESVAEWVARVLRDRLAAPEKTP